MRVKVYYNSRKKCYSVQNQGKVIAYRESLVLHNCEFKVNENGRQRVIAEKRKNVHAFIIGDYNIGFEPKAFWGNKILYNPYKYENFVREDCLTPIHSCKDVYILTNGVFEVLSWVQ